MILPEIYNSIRYIQEQAQQSVNPMKDDNWQYMRYGDTILEREENNIIVDSDVVTWKESSTECEQHNLSYIQATLEEACCDMSGNGIISTNLEEDPIAQEALQTLALSLATTTRTIILEKHADINECIFTQE